MESNNKFLPAKTEEKNNDLEYSRSNMYTLVETAMAGLENFVPIVQQSQNARAYEVFFNAIKTTAELNEKLADLSIKKEEETEKEKKLPSGDTVQNNHLYVGTAQDLQKLLEQVENKKKE